MVGQYGKRNQHNERDLSFGTNVPRFSPFLEIEAGNMPDTLGVHDQKLSAA